MPEITAQTINHLTASHNSANCTAMPPNLITMPIMVKMLCWHQWCPQYRLYFNAQNLKNTAIQHCL